MAAGSTRTWSGSGLTAEQQREAEQAEAEELHNYDDPYYHQERLGRMRKHFREIATEQQQRRSREDVIQRLVLHAVRNGDVISTLSLHASEEMMSSTKALILMRDQDHTHHRLPQVKFYHLVSYRYQRVCK